MTDASESPPPASPGSIDSGETPSAEDSRKVLEGLAGELTDLVRCRRQLPLEAFAFALQLWSAAAKRHLRLLGVSEKQIAAILDDQRELVEAAHSARSELTTLIEQFDHLNAENPEAAEVFVKRFAEIGQFIVAERRATHTTSGRTQ